MYFCAFKIESYVVIKPLSCKKKTLLRDLSSTHWYFFQTSTPNNSYSVWPTEYFLFHHQWTKIAFMSVTECDINLQYETQIYPPKTWLNSVFILNNSLSSLHRRTILSHPALSHVTAYLCAFIASLRNIIPLLCLWELTITVLQFWMFGRIVCLISPFSMLGES